MLALLTLLTLLKQLNKLKSVLLFTGLCLTATMASAYMSNSVAATSEQQASQNALKQQLRIVAMAPHIVEMLYEIGAGEQIIGTVDYADYPAAAKNIERIGGYYGMQIEKLLALKPDLVIAWQSGNKKSDIEQIQRLGLKLVLSQPNQLTDIAKELRTLGQLTGHQQQAEQVASRYEKKLAQIIDTNSNKKPLRLFYQLWSEPMMTVNKQTWINQLIDICQGINVFADNPTQYPQISIENVIVAQPDLMVMPDEKSAAPQPEIAWHKWPEIPAVKHQRFIHVNADLLHRFSSRMLGGLDELCGKIDLHR